MMQWMWGFHGDRIMVNGKADNLFSVKSAPYRLRIANVSNARIYKLYLNDESKITLIGTDGGLLEKPIHKDYLILSPGERAEVILDFSDRQATDRIELRSAPVSGIRGGMMGHGGGMMGHGRMGRGMMMSPAGIFDEDLLIATFEVTVKVNVPFELPQRLSKPEFPKLEDAVNRDDPRRFYFEMRMMQLTINGRSFEMNEVASDEIVTLGTTEVWEIVNVGPMPHPVHIHGLQFKIVAREGTRPEYVAGYTDEGWKDTFLLMPGERAYVLIRFEDFTGTYLYHCHNLKHSDLGMMRNYKIVE
jgi:FtsP/CotA-like multicopper oxidase with cupredoxin domain